MAKKTNIRNIAVIAHVDHGKTTLVDAMLKQTHVFRDNQHEMQEERIMDSNDLERERGITILAKNCSISYKDTKINIIDTPGHADFSGEVERTLGMADGALLIVDAQEGPMPQTRFVLRKALELNLKIIVVINKIDKKFAQPTQVEHKIESLFLELAQDDMHLDYPVLFAIGKDGSVFNELPQNFQEKSDILPLLDVILKEIPEPKGDVNLPFKMLVSSIDYDSHLGKIAVGKVFQGGIKAGEKMIIAGNPETIKVEKIFTAEGLEKIETEKAETGDIAFIAGAKNIKIGDTLATSEDPEALPTIEIGEPTIHLTLGANTSPFFGREGKFSTSRQLEERLTKELEKNLSLKLEKLPSGKFRISGRGELHLSILLENLRREGYEMEVSKPQVVVKEVDGIRLEPVEEIVLLVPSEFTGTINQELGKRYATLIKMEPVNENETEFIYKAPTRAIMGLRNVLLTQTKGTVLISSQVIGFEPLGKSIPKMRSGCLIASQSGEVLSYGLRSAQDRGITFVGPGINVYEGMIVGKNSKDEDISVNVCKGKKLTNMRSKSSDGIIQLAPPVTLSLEQCLDFLENDELLEITPQSLRLRKKHLTENDRRRESRKVRQDHLVI